MLGRFVRFCVMVARREREFTGRKRKGKEAGEGIYRVASGCEGKDFPRVCDCLSVGFHVCIPAREVIAIVGGETAAKTRLVSR